MCPRDQLRSCVGGSAFLILFSFILAFSAGRENAKMKEKSMRNALPPTQLRNWSRGHMSCWLLTPARARQSGRPSQCVPSSLRTEIISRISSPLPPSPQEFLPAHRALSSEIFPAEETTFKLKLGPRHQVSLCTV